jgi:hypothetical protein
VENEDFSSPVGKFSQFHSSGICAAESGGCGDFLSVGSWIVGKIVGFPESRWCGSAAVRTAQDGSEASTEGLLSGSPTEDGYAGCASRGYREYLKTRSICSQMAALSVLIAHKGARFSALVALLSSAKRLQLNGLSMHARLANFGDRGAFPLAHQRERAKVSVPFSGGGKSNTTKRRAEYDRRHTNGRSAARCESQARRLLKAYDSHASTR